MLGCWYAYRFKYFNVIPQMGMLIKVLSDAAGPVLIFTTVSLVPCFGISLSYHVAYGQLLPNYSTVSLSLNTVLRMAVGDFNFREIYAVRPTQAVVLFWVTALLLVFTLINIFVAIILKSYDSVVADNPDANDSSQFMAMVFMQAKKTTMSALNSEDRDEERGNAQPHVIGHRVQHIDKDEYWDIFDNYWELSARSSDVATEPKHRHRRKHRAATTPRSPPSTLTTPVGQFGSPTSSTPASLRISVPVSPTESEANTYVTTTMLQRTNDAVESLAAQVQQVQAQTNAILTILRRMDSRR